MIPKILPNSEFQVRIQDQYFRGGTAAGTSFDDR